MRAARGTLFLVNFGSLSRRTWLSGAALVGAAAAVDALVVEPHWLEVSEHEVHVPGLPRSLDGFRLAQVTDAHLTGLGRVEEALLHTVAAKNVQVVALTGDIIDSSAQLHVLCALLSALTQTGARVVGTLGNWEHWGDVHLPGLAQAYVNAGGRLVVNATHVLSGVALAATDDSTGGKADVRRTLDGARGEARILLTHSPALLDERPKGAPPLALSIAGHTHGGQIRLGAVAPVVPPGSGRFVAGWYETAFGPAYVSRGTRTSLVPARFFCRPELPIFTLRQG